MPMISYHLSLMVRISASFTSLIPYPRLEIKACPPASALGGFLKTRDHTVHQQLKAGTPWTALVILTRWWAKPALSHISSRSGHHSKAQSEKKKTKKTDIGDFKRGNIDLGTQIWRFQCMVLLLCWGKSAYSSLHGGQKQRGNRAASLSPASHFIIVVIF